MKKNIKRRIVYIDGTLQGLLITALILLESMMVIAALVYLRFRYSALLDNYLYSIHFGSVDDFLTKLVHELIIVVVVMSVVNFIALLIANAFWGQYIHRIISCFRTVLKKIQLLDLSGTIPSNAPRHEALDQLDLWRHGEATRWRKLLESLSRYEAHGTKHNDERLTEIRYALSLLAPAPDKRSPFQHP